MSVSKTRLVEDVANVAEMTKVHAAKAIDTLLHAITHHAAAGEKVIIQGFGTFEMKTRAARTGRNPATGLPIEIPASTALHFKPARSKA